MMAWPGKPRHSRIPFVSAPFFSDPFFHRAFITVLLLFLLAPLGHAESVHKTATPALIAPPMPLTQISDEELSTVAGQALITIEKRIGDGGMNGDAGINFTRVAIGAKIEVNADVENIVLGHYPIPSEDGHQWNTDGLDTDIKANNVSFGCNSCADGEKDMTLENPYVEFAYKNDGTANRKLVGVRIGFDQLRGWLSGNLQAISGDMTGSLCIFGGWIGGLDCAAGGIQGPRSSNIRATALLGLYNVTVPLEVLHSLAIGGVGGGGMAPARNFYFGFQTQMLNYPKNGTGPQGVAHPGFWINLQDGLDLNLGQGLAALSARDNTYGPIGPNNLVWTWIPSPGFLIPPLPIPHYPAVYGRM